MQIIQEEFPLLPETYQRWHYLFSRLEPFGITVVDLKTGAVSTNLIKTQKVATQITLPKGSIYEPAREAVESAMRNDKMADVGMPAQQ